MPQQQSWRSASCGQTSPTTRGTGYETHIDISPSDGVGQVQVHLNSKLLSSSDPHPLTFYLTVCSDILPGSLFASILTLWVRVQVWPLHPELAEETRRNRRKRRSCTFVIIQRPSPGRQGNHGFHRRLAVTGEHSPCKKKSISYLCAMAKACFSGMVIHSTATIQTQPACPINGLMTISHIKF